MGGFRTKFRRKVGPFFQQLLSVDFIRLSVAVLRWAYFAKILRRTRTMTADGASENTVSHNVRGMIDMGVRRSLVLIRPLSAALSAMRRDETIDHPVMSGVSVLSIGPRTEGELLNLVAHGFEPSRIRGIDLISYSPWVDLGDMHAMPYADNSWDVVIAGWVLAYSDDKQRAATEIIRVAKNNAVIAIGVEYSGRNTEDIIRRIGYLPGSTERIRSVGAFMKYFDGHVGRVLFSHDVADERKADDAVALICVFTIRKIDQC